MPPAAMASRLVVAMARASAEPEWACMRSSRSMLMAWGNLGAPPKPPQVASNWAWSWPKAAVSTSVPGRAWPGASSVDRPMASVSPSACSSRSARRVRHTSSMRSHRSVNDSMPPRRSLGK